MTFDDSILRFACSGTLLGCYGLTEVAARRAGAVGDRPGAPPPRWLRPASWVLLTGFYLLIPTGGSMAGGFGNLAGIVLAFAAMILRYVVRGGVPTLRHPVTATRQLFYVALPLAVGVPWGWLVLTLPSLVISVHCNLREERLLGSRLAEAEAAGWAAAHRWIPGVW